MRREKKGNWILSAQKWRRVSTFSVENGSRPGKCRGSYGGTLGPGTYRLELSSVLVVETHALQGLKSPHMHDQTSAHAVFDLCHLSESGTPESGVLLNMKNSFL
jgi:hypothetical protein